MVSHPGLSSHLAEEKTEAERREATLEVTGLWVRNHPIAMVFKDRCVWPWAWVVDVQRTGRDA